MVGIQWASILLALATLVVALSYMSSLYHLLSGTTLKSKYAVDSCHHILFNLGSPLLAFLSWLIVLVVGRMIATVLDVKVLLMQETHFMTRNV